MGVSISRRSINLFFYHHLKLLGTLGVEELEKVLVFYIILSVNKINTLNNGCSLKIILIKTSFL